jgi:putative drug exporter of the RND superfamily
MAEEDAGLASMLGSELRIIAQLGSTIAIGLLLDTLVVRTLLMPSIATLPGKWFWWPQVVRPRGDNDLPQTRPPTDDADTDTDTDTDTEALPKPR